MAETLRRLSYYAGAALRAYGPFATARARARLMGLLPDRLEHVPEAVRDRVAYCNRLSAPVSPPPPLRLGELSIGRATASAKLYTIDLLDHARGFGPGLRVAPLFGDVIHVPDYPSLVKSRPIAGDVANSVLMPLDILRHFNFPRDPRPWSAKTAAAVWRGRLNGQPPRIAAVRRHGASARHDIGQIEAAPGLPAPKGWLTIAEQLRYRYILSLEGNDVATNLKWIMASNSVALAPRLEFETWFMEGRLVPGTHFVEIRPDLADLDDRIAWCEANPEAVQGIVANAQAWVRQFRDPRREAQVAALVLQKYAEMTGGPAGSPTGRRLFT